MTSNARFALFLLLAWSIGACAYGRHIERGDQAYAQGDYEAALNEYEAAQAKEPDSEEAQQKIAATKEKLASVYSEEVARALAANEHLAAADAAQRASIRLPDNPVTYELVEQVATATLAHAKALEDQQSYAPALALYEGLAVRLPSQAGKAQPRITAVRHRWAATLSERGAAAALAGRVGDAALLYTKAATLSDAPEHAARAEALRAQILREYVYVVALGAAKTPGEQYVMAGLAKTELPPAMRLESVGAGSGEENGRVSATLTLAVGAPRFDVESSSRTETATFQSGTRQVENPFYDNRRRDVERAERDVLDAENDVTRYESDVARYEEAVAREGDTPNTSTGAEQSLSRARSDLESARRRVTDRRRQLQRAREALADEPQFREEPVYADLAYTVITQTQLAEAEFSARVGHGDGRTDIEVVRTLDAQASDDSHPAQPTAGVPEDPLELPPRDDLVVALYHQALELSWAMIDQSFGQWRQALLSKALAAPTDDERVDGYVIYLLTDPAAPVPTPVPVDLGALRGIPDAEALLLGL
ncbi:hypothetical protein [Haliangium sp.]|uniref:hypothetical protein n=1 Tax=Haliangium sp. TaxID=2663208 RepID=UPI003D0C7647